MLRIASRRVPVIRRSAWGLPILALSLLNVPEPRAATLADGYADPGKVADQLRELAGTVPGGGKISLRALRRGGTSALATE